MKMKMKIKILTIISIILLFAMTANAEEYKVNYSDKIIYVKGNIGEKTAEGFDLPSVSICIRNSDDVKYFNEIPVDKDGNYMLKYKYNGQVLGDDYKLYVKRGKEDLAHSVEVAEVTSSGIDVVEFKVANSGGNNQLGLSDNISFSADIKNKCSDNIVYNAAVAVYDKDNRMIDVSKVELPIDFFDIDIKERILNSDIKVSKDADTIKVFLFDSMETLHPITTASTNEYDFAATANMFDVVNPYKVAFAGDSLTHLYGYFNYVEHFYTTRYPNNQISFINKGIAGDDYGYTRYYFDVVNNKYTGKPDEMIFGMGMNCFWWAYEPGITQGALEWRKQVSFSDWVKGVDYYIDNASADGIKITLAQFEFYDDYYNTLKSPGINASLNDMSDYLRETAKAKNLDYIITHNELFAISDEIRENYPELSDKMTMKIDGVHDTSGGGAINAAKFVQKQGAQLYVANVSISDDESNAENAEISDVVKNGDYVSFNFHPYSIPMAYADGMKDAKERLHYNLEDFNNREMFKISDLSDGAYQIVFNGTPLEKTYTSDELEGGVNIAIDANNPDQITAKSVYEKNKQKGSTESKLRGIASIEYAISRKDSSIDMFDDTAKINYVEKELEKIKNGETSDIGDESKLSEYLVNKANEAQIWNETQSYAAEAKSLCVPSTSFVEIVKIK